MSIQKFLENVIQRISNVLTLKQNVVQAVDQLNVPRETSQIDKVPVYVSVTDLITVFAAKTDKIPRNH